MNRIFIGTLALCLGLNAMGTKADPANMAGDVYRITNYIDPATTPDGLDVEISFNDDFLDRLGPGDTDTSLLGVNYAAAFNAPIFGQIVFSEDTNTGFEPDSFYIEYDGSGNPTLFRLALDSSATVWELTADLSTLTGNMTYSALGIEGNLAVTVEFLVDGEPGDIPGEVEDQVDPDILAAQELLLNYYDAVVDDPDSSNNRILNHGENLSAFIRDLATRRQDIIREISQRP